MYDHLELRKHADMTSHFPQYNTEIMLSSTPLPSILAGLLRLEPPLEPLFSVLLLVLLLETLGKGRDLNPASE